MANEKVWQLKPVIWLHPFTICKNYFGNSWVCVSPCLQANQTPAFCFPTIRWLDKGCSWNWSWTKLLLRGHQCSYSDCLAVWNSNSTFMSEGHRDIYVHVGHLYMKHERHVGTNSWHHQTLLCLRSSEVQVSTTPIAQMGTGASDSVHR